MVYLYFTFHNFSLTYTSLPFGNELGKIGSKLPKVQLLSRAIIQTQVCPSFPQTHHTKQTILQNGSCNHGPLLRKLLNATHSYGEQAWDAFSNALSCWGRYYLWPIWVEPGVSPASSLLSWPVNRLISCPWSSSAQSAWPRKDKDNSLRPVKCSFYWTLTEKTGKSQQLVLWGMGTQKTHRKKTNHEGARVSSVDDLRQRNKTHKG